MLSRAAPVAAQHGKMWWRHAAPVICEKAGVCPSRPIWCRATSRASRPCMNCTKPADGFRQITAMKAGRIIYIGILNWSRRRARTELCLVSFRCANGGATPQPYNPCHDFISRGFFGSGVQCGLAMFGFFGAKAPDRRRQIRFPVIGFKLAFLSA